MLFPGFMGTYERFMSQSKLGSVEVSLIPGNGKS